jgi:hypothetical protein
VFIVFLVRFVRKGPDLSSPIVPPAKEVR